MAYRSRRYRYRSARRPYRNAFRRAARATARQFAAANSQRDLSRCTIKYAYNNPDAPFQVVVPQGASQAGIVLDISKVLIQNPQYTAFSSMFDQAKMNGIRIKLTPLFQAASPAEFAPTQRPSVVWAWDRNGITSSAYYTGNTAYTNVGSYGSARSSTISPGNSGTIVSSIYATDLVERNVYFSTRQANGNTLEPAFAAAAFCPDFLLAVKLAANATAQTTFAYQVEVWFDITFRGVRYSGVSQ